MENKNYTWRPVSEYTGGRVLATNDLDVLIGEINSEGDCESEEGGSTILCGITGFIKIEEMLPELKESEDERIRKWIKKELESKYVVDNIVNNVMADKALAWLEKQGEQKAIKHNNDAIIDSNLNDYCCKVYNALHKENGGNLSFARLQHLAMDIYKWCKEQQKHAEWSEEYKRMLSCAEEAIKAYFSEIGKEESVIHWLKSLKERYTWKPSDEQMNGLKEAIEFLGCTKTRREQLKALYEQLKKL